LGRAIAVGFAREGCSNIAVGDLDSAELEETQNVLRSYSKSLSIEAITLDLTDETSTASFFQKAIDKFGRVDFLANIASYEPPLAGAHEIEETDFDEAFSSNQKAVGAPGSLFIMR